MELLLSGLWLNSPTLQQKCFICRGYSLCRQFPTCLKSLQVAEGHHKLYDRQTSHHHFTVYWCCGSKSWEIWVCSVLSFSNCDFVIKVTMYPNRNHFFKQKSRPLLAFKENTDVEATSIFTSSVYMVSFTWILDLRAWCPDTGSCS